MNPETNHQYIRLKKVYVVFVLIALVAGLIGWGMGRANSNNPTEQAANTPTSKTQESSSLPSVKSLVSYTLPDGWKEATCYGAPGSVFISPPGSTGIDCGSNPSAPIKISVDPANNTDCNQLQNVQNVTKHICISEYINGHKSLKAETIYNKESSYKTATAINAYYINTGKGVIKVEYVRGSGNNEYLAGLEQLAKSVQVK